jgi:hypothetical protein
VRGLDVGQLDAAATLEHLLEELGDLHHRLPVKLRLKPSSE